MKGKRVRIGCAAASLLMGISGTYAYYRSSVETINKIAVGDVNIGIVGEKEDFNYELSCGMGELEVFDESYTSLGKDKEIDNGARYTISLECGVGKVTVFKSEQAL